MKAPLLGSLLLAQLAPAATVVSDLWDVSAVIPDNSATGWSDTRYISSVSVEITNVEVYLETTGGFNGDLYAYLTHDSGFSVLLNRVGRTESNPDGSFTTGMSVVFSNTADEDIHSAVSMYGVYQPDGRNVSPLTVTETVERTATLMGFNGLDPNGGWTLFVADVSPGYEATVVSWGLTVTTSEAVPEPSTIIGAGVMSLLAMFRRRRDRNS
ncbi:PEP-CTERM sorting domain-containing protein [Luteolibacter marinus]|uniref:PEP-CTERM sorting domain-containing protein n=1 Tax=Luteolibacter marinus TaxID=2776705 RepID=UPI0018670FFB|nr:PEP-CTERM sorting domain-containing protein [Luteolibacter marinus]